MRKILCLTLCMAATFMAKADEWAIASLPVSCIRSEASHSSEMVSQATLGTPMRILARSGQWYKVETPDGYTGMMLFNSAKVLSQQEFDEWRSSDRRICTSTWQPLFLPTDSLQQQGYATYGTILDSTDPRVAAEIHPLAEWAEEAYRNRSAEGLIQTAFSMLGAPYLWGGVSSIASDCSGFTQRVYMSAGMLLPRDAWQQAEAGLPVASLREARPGDLIFFGRPGKINHVAIYLGDGRIIHCSGQVRTCRLGPQYPGEDELFTETPVCIRRYLDDAPVPGVKIIREHPFYFKE